MSKKTKKINLPCQQHHFYLKPLNKSCKFIDTISLSFCDPSKHKPKNKTKQHNQKLCQVGPVFNKDRNFATPTFILQSQKVLKYETKQYYEVQGQNIKEQHEKKMINYSDQKDSLNVPRPRTNNNYCNVCKQIYDDYLNHIQTDIHKINIRNSVFNRSILELTQKFNLSSATPLTCSKQTFNTEDEDDFDIIQSTPKKKIKTDPTIQDYTQNFLKLSIPPMVPPPHLNINNATYFPSFSNRNIFQPYPVNYFQNTMSMHPNNLINNQVQLYQNQLNNQYIFLQLQMMYTVEYMNLLQKFGTLMQFDFNNNSQRKIQQNFYSSQYLQNLPQAYQIDKFQQNIVLPSICGLEQKRNWINQINPQIPKTLNQNEKSVEKTKKLTFFEQG